MGAGGLLDQEKQRSGLELETITTGLPFTSEGLEMTIQGLKMIRVPDKKATKQS
ncbi:MAG: hypothetical protein ABSD41_05400 [Candidatus Bathyarchaeia archaeon]|jgi:hypothetical protein